MPAAPKQQKHGLTATKQAAILSGAVVGRMKFWVWCVFIFIWTTIVYDVFAHWVWAWTVNPTTFQAVPYGWLVSGAHDVVVLDFAGGIAVCIVSGFSALAAALVLGPRKSQEPPTAHDVPLVLFGATALWFGWREFSVSREGVRRAQLTPLSQSASRAGRR